MKRDFTIQTYVKLLDALHKSGYTFQRFDEFLLRPNSRVVVLRHDVDKKPENSLTMAKLQSDKGIKGVYYFRAKKCSWNDKIIQEINALGHEIGYHYENMATTRGHVKQALGDFEIHLKELRKLAKVSTICMHGSPFSKYDNREMWKSETYKSYGIIGEPYFDIDFNKVLYLTDTGRTWNAGKRSIRDKVNSSYNFQFNSTHEIIESINSKELPNLIMFNFHPQRWNDKNIDWLKEKISQGLKNPIKKMVNAIRS